MDGTSKLSGEHEDSKAACAAALPVPVLFPLPVPKPSTVSGKRGVWTADCGMGKDRGSSRGPSRSSGICPSGVDVDWEPSSAGVHREDRRCALAGTC